MPNLKNRSGQGLIEYILVVVLMAIATMSLVRNLSTTTQHGFTKATNELSREFDH